MFSQSIRTGDGTVGDGRGGSGEGGAVGGDGGDGGDGGGGGGGDGKQSSQPASVTLLSVRHSMGVPSGKTPSGEMMSQ